MCGFAHMCVLMSEGGIINACAVGICRMLSSENMIISLSKI